MGTSADFADIFGKNNQNNVRREQGTIRLIDTIKPTIILPTEGSWECGYNVPQHRYRPAAKYNDCYDNYNKAKNAVTVTVTSPTVSRKTWTPTWLRLWASPGVPTPRSRPSPCSTTPRTSSATRLPKRPPSSRSSTPSSPPSTSPAASLRVAATSGTRSPPMPRATRPRLTARSSARRVTSSTPTRPLTSTPTKSTATTLSSPRSSSR